MGIFKGAAIVEQRIYDDPQNPETSDYHVGLPITTTNAVFNPDTGKSLDETLQQIESGTGGVGAATDAEDIKQTAITGSEGEELTVNEALAVLSGKIGGEENVGEALETIRESLSKKANNTAATTSAAGLMSTADKTKLNGIAAGAQVNPGNATISASGLMSPTDKTKLDGIETGATKTTGLIQLEITFAPGFAGKSFTVTAPDGVVFSGIVPGSREVTIPVPLLKTTYTIECDGISDPVVVGSFFGIYWVQFPLIPILSPIEYTMLYDVGDENTIVTGGFAEAKYDVTNKKAWVKEPTALSMSSTGSYIGGSIQTTSKIPLSNQYLYAKFSVTTFSSGFLACGIRSTPHTTSIASSTTFDKASYSISAGTTGTIFAKIDVSSLGSNYVALGSYISTASGTIKTSVSHIWLAEINDWKKWVELSGLAPSNYIDLNAVVENSGVMTVLSNSAAACNYMLACSGTIMCAVLGSDTAWATIPASLKTRMAQDSNWVKFAYIFGRTLI